MPHTNQEKQLAALGAAMDSILDGRASRRPTLDELYRLNLARENDLRVPVTPWDEDGDIRDSIRSDYESDMAADAREERE